MKTIMLTLHKLFSGKGSWAFNTVSSFFDFQHTVNILREVIVLHVRNIGAPIRQGE